MMETQSTKQLSNLYMDGSEQNINLQMFISYTEFII